jgi:integrase
MPRQSATDNVRKICGCAKWKTCAHPWYVDYQRDNVRYRPNLDKLIDRHAPDFLAAKDEARRAIVALLAGRDPKSLLPDDDPTVAQILEAYDRVRPRVDRWHVGRITRAPLASPLGVRPFGEWRASVVTTDTLRQFRQTRTRVSGNRDLNLLRAAYNWAVLQGQVPRSPFRIGDVPAIKMEREEARTRRLQPGEDARLLDHAGKLRDIITAAIETGMRRGEILSLQWQHVRFAPRAEVFLPAVMTKTKRDRRVPMSVALRAVLERRQFDVLGERLGPDAYVFGDEIGRRRGSITAAWRSTVTRAAIVDLHFHDLRREAGSRWMDAGIPLATIQRWLGHTNIAQTSTYLGASLGGDEHDMRAFDLRMGRLPALTHIDGFDGSIGLDRTPSDQARTERLN